MLRLDQDHRWDLSPREAAVLQKELASHVRATPLRAEPRTIAGVDVIVRDKRALAAVVVMTWPALADVEYAVWSGPAEFPYVPGLLSFRELPAILRAIEKLKRRPNLVFVDGQGIAHPRRFGLAAHLGVLLDCPTIGVAKSRLVGAHGDVDAQASSMTPLVDKDEVIGMVVRTRSGTKPLYVSVGHKITLDEAVKWVLQSVTGYRLPEPTRRADLLSRITLD